MVSSWTERYNRRIGIEEQKLYDHLLERIEFESPDQLIERFKVLFIEGMGYPDRRVTSALDSVINSKRIDEDFRFVLNRCCHILINRWLTRSHLQSAIPDLVNLFESPSSKPINEFARATSVRRLRELTDSFIESEQYLTLSRLARVVNESSQIVANRGEQPLGTLIHRYPYLYQHCLLSEDSGQEHQRTIEQIQSRAQKKFEIDLSQYVTYQVRRSRLAYHTPDGDPNRILRSVENPTLLSDQELVKSLQHFSGKVEGTNTYRDLAKSFVAHSRHITSYKAFKGSLYEYITASIDAGYGDRKFNNLLHAHLLETFPESDAQTVDDFLKVRTYSQLFNFLVVESSQNPEHFVFVDLINNLGPILTTGLLLKIVLLCRKVKPYLERRFSILFGHYESYQSDAVHWLVQTLETLNLAFSTNFGAMDLSFIHQAV
ncbi:MAG: hypothetical protein F6K19_08285 [Cyanothece sp. SIO1E1]|nr:hypothetical protein [Cyanothece sp. SIO1E1]